MTIANRLKMNIILSAGVVLIMIAAFGAAFIIEGQARDQYVLADNLMKEMSELNEVTDYYIRHPEERPKVQWKLKYADLMETLKHLRQRQRRDILVDRMNRDLDEVRVLFNELVSTHERGEPFSAGSNPDEALLTVKREQLADLIALRSRSIKGTASRIAADSLVKDSDIHRTEGAIFPVFAITMIVVAVWSSTRISRSIAGPIEKLRKSAEIFGTGNLDHRIGLTSDDEVGQLAREFDSMAASLKETTASRDDLAKEVTERRRAEEALIAAHERAVWLARFPDENPNPVLRVSHDGSILYRNPAAAILAGWACEAGQPLPDLLLPLVGQAMEQGQMAQEDVQLGGRFYSVSVTPFPADKYANIYGRDITEDKRAEQERQTTVDFLQLVNSTAGFADLVHKAAAFFQERSGCEAVGIRLKEGDDYPYYEARGFPKEFVRMESSLCTRNDSFDILRDDSGNPVLACMCGNIICGRFDASKPFFTVHGSFWTNSTTQLLASTTEADRQARTRNRCNGEGYESVALISLHVGQERQGLIQLNDHRKGMFDLNIISLWERLAGYLAVALAKSRTEEELRESTEELKRSNADLQQFAYAASHDLQEPLRGLACFAGLLEKRYKGKLDERADEFIDYIINDAIRMQELIKDLLEYSTIEIKSKILTHTNCSVVLEEAFHNLRSAVEETGAELTYDLLPAVMADASQLRRLFQNLIGNAIKFRSKEKPRIHISAERKGNELVFAVKDNGIGFDSEFAARIFVVFQRLHTRREYPGTGIGLAISKKIVEHHGGRIWAESESGKGSTFFFALPLQ